MSKAKVIHTRYVIEVIDRDWEYHVTTSSDLKDIYDVDTLNFGSGEQHSVIDLLSIIQNLFFQNKLNLE